MSEARGVVGGVEWCTSARPPRHLKQLTCLRRGYTERERVGESERGASERKRERARERAGEKGAFIKIHHGSTVFSRSLVDT